MGSSAKRIHLGHYVLPSVSGILNTNRVLLNVNRKPDAKTSTKTNESAQAVGPFSRGSLEDRSEQQYSEGSICFLYKQYIMK